MSISDSTIESGVSRSSNSTSHTSSFQLHLSQVFIARLPLEMYQMLDLGRKVTSQCCFDVINIILIET